MIMNEDKEKRVLKYPISTYSLNTLMHGWVEDRLRYKKVPNTDQRSTYQAQFIPKPLNREDEHFAWDLMIKAEGVDVINHPKTGYLDRPNYFNNYTSAYDLAFNHFPKWYKDEVLIPRKYRASVGYYEPVEEYIPTFDNATSRGLVDYKKLHWCENKMDPRKTMTTLYKDTFIAPQPDHYVKKRFATPQRISTNLFPFNQCVANVRWRNSPPPFAVPVHPPEPCFPRIEAPPALVKPSVKKWLDRHEYRAYMLE